MLNFFGSKKFKKIFFKKFQKTHKFLDQNFGSQKY